LSIEAGDDWSDAMYQCQQADVFNPTGSMTVEELLGVLAPICAILPGDKHVEFLAMRMEAMAVVEPLSPTFCRSTVIKCAERVHEETDRFLNHRVRWEDQCTGVRMVYGTEPCTRNELVHYFEHLYWGGTLTKHPDDLAMDTLINYPHMDDYTSGDKTTSRRDMNVSFGGDVRNFSKVEW
jgi:hypothetical protein